MTRDVARRATLLVVVAVVTAACGGGGQTASPASPTPPSEAEVRRSFCENVLRVQEAIDAVQKGDVENVSAAFQTFDETAPALRADAENYGRAGNAEMQRLVPEFADAVAEMAAATTEQDFDSDAFTAGADRFQTAVDTLPGFGEEGSRALQCIEQGLSG